MRRTVEIIEERGISGPRILMLPGLGNRGAGFRPLARALSQRARVSIVEYPEGRHAAVGAEALAAEVAEVVGPVDAVIASSFGGMVAGHLARTTPIRGAAFLGSFTKLRHLGVRASLIRLMGPAAMVGAYAAPLMARVAAYGRVRPEHCADIIPSTPAERSAVLHRAWTIPTESHGVELRDLPISCIALQGTHDLLVPASTLPRLAGALPEGSATHLIRGAGHVPYLTHVEECARLLGGLDRLACHCDGRKSSRLAKRLLSRMAVCTFVQVMPGPAELQLLLLDTSAFEAGPSRARGPRRVRLETESSETLTLQFERPTPTPQPILTVVEDARRLALERSRARLRAKLEPVAPLQRAAPVEAPAHDESQVPTGPEGDASPVLVFVLLVRKKLGAVTRASMMKAFADRLGGDLRRSDHFDARVDNDSVTGRLDAKSLVIRFSSPAARYRWLPTLQRLAREHDLVEPE